jgi:bifunctional non-homologous end joining protein LigD
VAKRTESVVNIGGRELKVSNLEKVLYPRAGFTKAQMIDYYVRVAPVLLPHLKDRPLTMKRYPEGVEGMFFYEKSCPKHRPDWVKTAGVWSAGRGDYIDFCLIQDLPTLVWAANLADIELHTSLSVAGDPMEPTMLVFDLDPGEPANIVQCCQVAFWLRNVFDKLGLKSFPKTSGSKGIQVYIPLNSKTSYDETKPFAHAVARLLEDEHPQQVVSDMKKALRVNRVFVDWSQNDDHKTTVCVYSLRARERPTVSTPVKWDEVKQCLERKDGERLVFTSDQVLERIEKLGDLFEPVLSLKQKLPKLGKIGDAKLEEHYGSYSAKHKPTAHRPTRATPKRQARKAR